MAPERDDGNRFRRDTAPSGDSIDIKGIRYSRAFAFGLRKECAETVLVAPAIGHIGASMGAHVPVVAGVVNGHIRRLRVVLGASGIGAV